MKKLILRKTLIFIKDYFSIVVTTFPQGLKLSSSVLTALNMYKSY
jgi:hypothetical protein